jgi:hypothetical protein
MVSDLQLARSGACPLPKSSDFASKDKVVCCLHWRMQHDYSMVKQDDSTRLSTDSRASFPAQAPNQPRPISTLSGHREIGIFSPHWALVRCASSNLEALPSVVSSHHHQSALQDIYYSIHVCICKTVLEGRETHIESVQRV